MKKISLVVFPALTIVLEALPLGAVCTFAPSPTERVRETFSYFSLIPFGYAIYSTYYSHTYCCYLVAFVDFFEER